jgi:hypothetical protein
MSVSKLSTLVLLGSQRTQELELFVGSLEATVSKLGTGIDKLDVDLLQMLARRVLHHALTKDKSTLLDTNDGALKHNPVFVDLTVVDESTHRGDTLLGQISLSLATFSITLLSNTVNLLVKFGTVEVTLLTSTGNGGRNTGRVPRSDTGNLTKTTMGLAGKTRDTPTSDDTLETVTLGHTEDINLFVLGEDTVNSDLLLEQSLGVVNLGSGVTSVDLDLHNVSLLQTKIELLDLSVGNHTNDRAKLLDTLEFGINILAAILLVLLGVLGESLFLTVVPVLVATTLEFLTQMLGKDSGQSAKTTGGLNVSNNTNHNHRRGLDNRNGIDDLTLVHEGTGAVDSTDDVGHTRLVTAESGQMRLLGQIVMGKRTNATRMVLGTLLGQETKGTVAGSFEFTVRPISVDNDMVENVSKW